LSSSVSNPVCITQVGSWLGQRSMGWVPLLLIRLLVEYVEIGVGTSRLEVCLLEEFNAFRFQSPSRFTVLCCSLKFAILLGMRWVATGGGTNCEMCSTDVVRSERGQVRVPTLAFSIEILVIFHSVRSQGGGFSSNENWVRNKLFFVFYALRGIACILVKGVFEAGLVVSNTAPLIGSHIKIRFQCSPFYIIGFCNTLNFFTNRSARNLDELSLIFTQSEVDWS
jgi:hypothetical protein